MNLDQMPDSQAVLDQMPDSQAVYAYSTMLYDSRLERDSLRRELNIVIQQYLEMTTERNYWKRQAELLSYTFIGKDEAQ